MRLISINVSMPKTVYHQGRLVNTGIFNEPVAGKVMVRNLNVDGDGQVDYNFAPLAPVYPGQMLLCCTRHKSNLVIDV